jgi:uncharacterized protein YfiM (DUF2279 family)
MVTQNNFAVTLLKACAALILVCVFSIAHSQSSDSINRKRLYAFSISSAVVYSTTLYGLNNLWYKNSERTSFHFFNDNAEWKQVDKFGHFFSSFYLSSGTAQAMRWCHLNPKKSDVIGALTGFLVLVPIEYFDGRSSAYGASTGDLIADAAGASFFLAQKLHWKQVRLIPKFSFHQTGFAELRPNVLGDSFVSEMIKDYNGCTYWISADVDKFAKFPKWLNIAVGYGANGMVYARDNMNQAMGYTAFRQYYLSVDFDLSGIKTKSKFIKSLIFIANAIKIPAPAIEFNRTGVRLHPLYF